MFNAVGVDLVMALGLVLVIAAGRGAVLIGRHNDARNDQLTADLDYSRPVTPAPVDSE